MQEYEFKYKMDEDSNMTEVFINGVGVDFIWDKNIGHLNYNVKHFEQSGEISRDTFNKVGCNDGIGKAAVNTSRF